MWPIRHLLIAAILAFSGNGVRAADNAPLVIRMAYLGQREQPVLPHSYLDVPPADEGVQGARLGIADNNTTGRFTGQRFELDEVVIGEDEAATDALHGLVGKGHRFVVVDLPAEKLLAIAALPESKDVTFFNARAKADELRGESCRANILHMIPSRAMLADALVQYLVLKRWQEYPARRRSHRR